MTEVTPEVIDKILDEFEANWQPLRFRDFLKVKLFAKKIEKEDNVVIITLVDNSQITYKLL